MKGIRRLSAAVAATVWVAALASPAGAGKAVSSAVTLKVAGGPPFRGRVLSKDPACIANRKVKLLEVSPVRGLIDLADNRTNGKGKWVFSSQLQGARVVQTKVSEQKTGGVICRSAVSPPKALY